MDKFREDTGRQLGPEACAALLPDDPASVKRVWDFLNHWGLINFRKGEGEASFTLSSAGLLTIWQSICDSAQPICYESAAPEPRAPCILEVCARDY